MLPSSKEPHFGCPCESRQVALFDVLLPMPTPNPSAPITWLNVVGVDCRSRVPLSCRPPIMIGFDESWMSVATL